jgi:hypothetical protein
MPEKHYVADSCVRSKTVFKPVAKILFPGKNVTIVMGERRGPVIIV